MRVFVSKLPITSLCSIGIWLSLLTMPSSADDAKNTEHFERRIRPLLIKHCYECHSEAAKEQQGGLILDRQSGWLKGGDTQSAIVPGEPDSSLLITAVRYTNEDLQMPPDGKLSLQEIRLLENWVQRGAAGPQDDLGDTEFSRLGDQDYLFDQAKTHWAFQPVNPVEPPIASDPAWNQNPIDQFVFDRLLQNGLSPSIRSPKPTLARRLNYSLTGLPPASSDDLQFSGPIEGAIEHTVSELLQSPAFGAHIGRMWLDVARYADTDSAYRPDTKTPHYFPFAFTYRDYVIDAFNKDKPFDQFVKEQLAADLMGFKKNAAQIAALGFIAVGPHANRSQAEALDDWIDTTSRGLMGMTVACARCHDHKYEPIPTADYYSLRGVFASIDRIEELSEKLPLMPGYTVSPDNKADFKKQRAIIDKKMTAAAGKKSKNNNRSIAQKIRETELAELLLFHPGGPAHAMVVRDKPKPVRAFVFLRGESTQRGPNVPRRFLKVIDPAQPAFPDDTSGRLQLAESIVSPDNPLTARVFVNRVWGMLMGSYLVNTPSDFGLQGDAPTHPQLLDWLAADFIEHGWSAKHLVRRIVTSQTWQQSSRHREDMSAIDPENKFLWRANRRHLSIEELRDSILAVAGQLDFTPRGHAGKIWGDDYTKRRTIYGFVNRFNLDPTLRAFDFPTPMQTQPKRTESIVPSQALFTLNSPFVVDQAQAITQASEFVTCQTDQERITAIYAAVFRRKPVTAEIERITKVLAQIERMNKGFKKNVKVTQPWPLVAQSLLMSNEFQYID